MPNSFDKELDLYLGFVRCLSIPDAEGEYIYEFYFTEYPDEFFGDDFGEVPCSICSDLRPYDETYSTVQKLHVPFKLVPITESIQFSVQDAIDNCVALCYEDLFDKEYPEDGRLVFHFGEKYDKVLEKLGRRNLYFEC